MQQEPTAPARIRAAWTPHDVAALLDAILEALDLPHPAALADATTYRSVLEDRAELVVQTLRKILGAGVDSAATDLLWETAELRNLLARRPPTYRHAPR